MAPTTSCIGHYTTVGDVTIDVLRYTLADDESDLTGTVRSRPRDNTTVADQVAHQVISKDDGAEVEKKRDCIDR